MMGQFLRAFLLSTLLANVTLAAPPTLRELRPWGAQRGQTVTLTLAGDALAAGAEVLSAVPGKLQEQPGANAGQIVCQLEIAPDAAVGVYPIRLRTPGGLSNALLFSVGDLPEVAETEPNDSVPGGQTGAAAAATALPLVTLPTTVNGTVNGTDQDVFRLAGKKGERLVAEVEAQRIGSVLDPVISLFTAAGRELATADDTPGLGVDCRLDFTLPDDGEYFLAVHDTKFNGGSPGQYRLKLGSLAYAESIFPLGWQRGREIEVTLFGGTFATPTKAKLTPQAPDGVGRTFLPLGVPGPQARLPFRFVLGNEPEAIEPADAERWFKDAGVMNGLIAQPGEVDRYKFPVKPGQTWVFEVEAASLDSQLDGLLTVLGPQGNVLASTDDGNGLDPRVQLGVPGDVDHVVLAVEDLHRRGGPGFAYRLKARPAQAEFNLQVVQPVVNVPRSGTAVVQVNAARAGYNGSIQLTIPENLAGISAEGGLIPEGGNEGFLVLSASADAPLRALDLEISGQGGSPAKPMRRPASAGGRSAYAMPDALAARVPAAITEAPPAVLSVAERTIRVLHGHSRTLKLTVQRGPAATEAINITGTSSPPQFGQAVSGAAGAIAKETSEVTLNLTSNPENPLVGAYTLQLTATTPAGGRQETIQLPPVRVELAGPFALEVLDRNINITAGAKTRISAIVRREAPFDGVVKVGPAGSLPQHVSLTTVDVPKGDSLALLELAIGDAVAPAEFDIAIRAATDMEGRKRDKFYNIPDTTVKVKIIPKTGS
jgi:hypothetical protein